MEQAQERMAQEPVRKLMICIDGSEQADHAFEWYLKNMKQPNDYVYGVIVPEYNLSGVSVISMVGPLADVNALSQEFKSQHECVEKMTSEYTARLRSACSKGQVDQYPGKKPGVTICEIAEKLDIDGIIMGTRGLSKIKQMIIGSVSNYVVHHALCPITIVPLKK